LPEPLGIVGVWARAGAIKRIAAASSQKARGKGIAARTIRF
jgi:hypothetical protein